MARSKQAQKNQKDGKHRKETREERKIRLAETQKAREDCEKLIPYALGILFVLMIAFAVYVRSLPPKVPMKKTTNLDDVLQQQQQTPMDAIPVTEQAAAETTRKTTIVLDDTPLPPPKIPEPETEETVEL